MPAPCSTAGTSTAATWPSSSTAPRPPSPPWRTRSLASPALTAEDQKLSMPASVFSRSTESHNQDKVSMGTLAARDCRRILDLTETVAVIALLAACQALDL